MKDNVLGSALTLFLFQNQLIKAIILQILNFTEAFAIPESEKFRTIKLVTEMNINEGDPLKFVLKLTNFLKIPYFILK